MQLKIINNNDAYTHVALSGSFDCEGVAEIFEDFKHNVTDRDLSAIIDMTEVGFISSLGLRTFVACAQELARSKHILVLYNPQPFVTDEVKLAKLDSEFPVTHDLGEALRLVTEQKS